MFIITYMCATGAGGRCISMGNLCIRRCRVFPISFCATAHANTVVYSVHCTLGVGCVAQHTNIGVYYYFRNGLNVMLS